MSAKKRIVMSDDEEEEYYPLPTAPTIAPAVAAAVVAAVEKHVTSTNRPPVHSMEIEPTTTPASSTSTQASAKPTPAQAAAPIKPEPKDEETKKPVSSSRSSSKRSVKKEEEDEDDFAEKKSSSRSASSSKKRSRRDEDEDDFEDEEEEKKDKKKRSSSSSSSKRSSSSSSSSKKDKKSSSSRSSSSSSKSSSRKRKADDDEEEEKPSKGKAKTAKGGRASKKAKTEEGESSEWKWWLEKKDGDEEGIKWTTLEWNGVLFPPAYEPHGVKLYYDGEPVELTSEQEEAATYYAQYLETDHVKKKTFNENFFKDFRALLKSTPAVYKRVTKFDLCDFTKINAFLQQRKEEKKTRTKEDKQKEKEEKEKITEKYGFALVDGHKVKIGNYRVEPPGLFLGRGAHPKTGHLKKRIMPEDVTINIGKDAKVPKCPIPGHKWGTVTHNNTVTWLAMWKETINGGFKYVWLSASSHIKGQSDMKKFETSRKLKNHIDKIRKNYMKDLKSKEKLERQRATALWVIDHLALRVGNEKGDDEADTVGCCSLRVEHVECIEPATIKFDFLGKDSMRYENSTEVPRVIFKNFCLFRKGKKPADDLFDRLTTTNLNSYLKSLMPGLTAKVFRTYNASFTLQQELNKPMPRDLNVAEKVLHYNRANRQVAILCNHQRSVPKSHSAQMEKLKNLVEELEAEKKKLQHRYELVKAGKPLPESESESEEENNEDGTPKKKKKASLPTDRTRIKKAIQKLDERIKNRKVEIEQKDELKTIALGTSKINYMDPRITAAWCKKHDVPIEKIFSKTLRDKFPWAMDVDADFKY